jgi:chromosome segregation ATPase
MAKAKGKTNNIAAKKTKAYDLLRQIGALSNQANTLREQLNQLETEIAALENGDT